MKGENSSTARDVPTEALLMLTTGNIPDVRIDEQRTLASGEDRVYGSEFQGSEQLVLRLRFPVR